MIEHSKRVSRSARMPRHTWLLVTWYGIASLIHFAHNAEYIAFYPNLPAWLTRERVWLAWLAITGIGFPGVVFIAAGCRTTAAALLAACGAFGLDGLAHYTLALCSDHTLVTNCTIGLEAAAGTALATSMGWWAWRQPRVRCGQDGF